MLEGKTAIVTGAARGLGQAYARHIAIAGANVVVADLEPTDAAIEAIGLPDRTLGMSVDVTRIESVRAMVDATCERFGSVDILVNNAALYGSLHGGRAEAIDEDEWDRCMAVNVKGVWNCCRAVIPTMRTQGGGSIINIASLAAIIGMPYSLHYSTSKAAIIGMTRSLARELGRDWIRVNTVAPTAVQTEGTSEFFGEKLDRQMEHVLKGQCLAKAVEPDDVAGTILHLASDASRLVTGQTFAVDGGTVFL